VDGGDRAKRSQAVDLGMAVAVGFSAERAPTLTQDGVISGYDSTPAEGGARLGDRQQLKHYFLDGSRDRLR
jgi:hypothetical protein